MTYLRRITTIGSGILSLATAPAALAQSAVWDLMGVVRSIDGKVLEGAIVEIAGANTRTDRDGFFKLVATRRDTMTLAVRRIGFGPVSALLTAPDLVGDTLLVIMDPRAQQIAGVTVKARDLRSPSGFGGFEQRRASGLGVFVGRAEITRQNTSRLSEVLRNKRGIYLQRLSNGSYGVRFSSYQGRGRGTSCSPELWLDGQRARGMEIDELPANTVEAVELYNSLATTPVQFSTSTAGTQQRCGTVVVWSRQAGTP